MKTDYDTSEWESMGVNSFFQAPKHLLIFRVFFYFDIKNYFEFTTASPVTPLDALGEETEMINVFLHQFLFLPLCSLEDTQQTGISILIFEGSLVLRDKIHKYLSAVIRRRRQVERVGLEKG